MKLESTTQWFTLIANVAVLVGIIFLAYELQQNNELLEAEIRTIRHDVRSSDYLLPLEHRDFAEALIKHRNEEDLSEYEALILDRAMANTLYNYQYVYVEYTLGRIDQDSLPMEVWRNDLDGDRTNDRSYWPDMRAYWDANKMDYDPAFVLWIDRNVIGR
jgi:hypothetical protein